MLYFDSIPDLKMTNLPEIHSMKKSREMMLLMMKKEFHCAR